MSAPDTTEVYVNPPPVVVYVGLLGRTKDTVRYHYKANCWARAGGSMRVPTLETAAQAVGIVPCSRCATVAA